MELGAICDLDETKAERARRRFGFGETYTDFREMLETEKPDAVFCVGGPKVHHSVGIEVLKRGYPLYVQKPPAPSSAAAREMAEAAASEEVVCHVGFNFRFAPAVQQAKSILRSEEFGQPLLGIFRYGLCAGRTAAAYVIDQHCHLLDLARFLLGDVRALQVTRSGLADARDYVAAVSFESGVVGTLNFTSGQIVDKEFCYFEITGQGTFLYSHGGASLVWRRACARRWWNDPQPDHVVERGMYGEHVGLEALGYFGDVANFVAAVNGDQEDLSPIGSTIGTMELCEEILGQLGEDRQ
jgi:myo-inositol 2-dehydrogenase/D-chiro-inositol 1-dehydrogenase